MNRSICLSLFFLRCILLSSPSLVKKNGRHVEQLSSNSAHRPGEQGRREGDDPPRGQIPAQPRLAALVQRQDTRHSGDASWGRGGAGGRVACWRDAGPLPKPLHRRARRFHHSTTRRRRGGLLLMYPLSCAPALSLALSLSPLLFLLPPPPSGAGLSPAAALSRFSRLLLTIDRPGSRRTARTRLALVGAPIDWSSPALERLGRVAHLAGRSRSLARSLLACPAPLARSTSSHTLWRRRTEEPRRPRRRCRCSRRRR